MQPEDDDTANPNQVKVELNKDFLRTQMKKKRKKDKFSQLDNAVNEILSDIKSKDPESKDDERQKIDHERLSDGQEDENS